MNLTLGAIRSLAAKYCRKIELTSSKIRLDASGIGPKFEGFNILAGF